MKHLWLTAFWLLTLVLAFFLGSVRWSETPSTSLGETEMRDAVTESLAERDPLQRTGQLVRLLEGLDRANLIGALDAYEARLDTTGQHEVRLFLHAWGRIDPAGALEHVAAWRSGKRDHAVSALAFEWARIHPQVAADALGRTDASIVDAAAPSLVQGWAISGQAGVEDWIADRRHGSERTRLVATLVAERIRAGRHDDVIAWAESVPPGAHENLKREVFKRVSNQLGAEDPERTAAWLAPHLGNPYARASMRELLRKWLPADPDAAWAWIAAKPASPERYDAIESGTLTWLRRDRQAAEQWIRTTDRSPLHDASLAAIADELVKSNPPEALDWASQIQDESLRLQALTRVGKIWARKAPDSARTWLRTSSLDADTRRQLRAAIGIRPAGSRPQPARTGGAGQG